MRCLLSLALVLALQLQAPTHLRLSDMAVAMVQVDGGQAYAPSLSVAFDASVTAGNLLYAAICVYECTPAAADLTDSRGNIWTLENVIYSSAVSEGLAVYTCIAKDSGACTVTFNDADKTGDQYLALAIAEFSGVVQTPDDEAQAGGTGTDIHHGDVDQITAGLYVGVCAQAASDTACTPDAGWDGTIYDNNLGSAYPGICANYELSSASTTYNYGWTYAASRTWCAIGITFPAAAGGSAIKTTQGLAQASVKTIQGLALSSVKTIQGLP
jgi:hypothetical protein